MCVCPNCFKKLYHKNIYKKKIINYQFGIKKIVFAYSINMQNLQQYREITCINNEINLLQDLLKKNQKIQNQFQNGLGQIEKKNK